jgi:hypothetical protein
MVIERRRRPVEQRSMAASAFAAIAETVPWNAVRCVAMRADDVKLFRHRLFPRDRARSPQGHPLPVYDAFS